MKKILFGIQIFSILASLPAYIVLELNRNTSAVTDRAGLMMNHKDLTRSKTRLSDLIRDNTTSGSDMSRIR